MRIGRLAVGIILAYCRCAFGLNASLDINQYGHTAWTIRDGTLKSVVWSIAQTPDGYLWLGTEFGLLRFDGIQFVPWRPPKSGDDSIGTVTRLFTSRDGRLWIGTQKRLLSWKDGSLLSYPQMDGQLIDSILEDSEGTIWVGGQSPSGSRLCAIRTNVVRCYGQDGSLGTSMVVVHEYSGIVWVGARNALWRWQPGPPRSYALPALDTLDLSDDGSRLIAATDKGLFQLGGDMLEPYPIEVPGQQFYPYQLLKDHDGGMWIGTTDRGLLHMHQARTDQFRQADGLSSDYVHSLFEDREGNVWVATQEGLDRFRSGSVSTVSVKQGLSADVGSVLSAKDGSVWLGTLSGLDYWINGQIRIFGKRDGLSARSIQSLFQDERGRILASTPDGLSRGGDDQFSAINGMPSGYAWSITGSGEDFWVSSVLHGLLHLRNGNLVEQTPWAALGRKDFASVVLADSAKGTWLGFVQGGVAYFKGRQARQYSEAEGLAPGRVNHLYFDRTGALWISTVGGLSRIQNGRVTILTTKNGLPCDSVHWTIEDDDRFFWLYTACGLVRIGKTDLDTWVANPQHRIQTTVLDAWDGVRLHSVPFSGYGPPVTKARDGKLWFAAGGGVSVLDPRHLEINHLPAPVHIEKIISDRETRWQNLSGVSVATLQLPALSRDLEIDYTALNLLAPEKIHFKYKLEGRDSEWQDVGNRRQAFYTDLRPRNYRFRVIASNNSGVWNEAGDTLDFSIAPAFYQTNLFYAGCAAAFCLALWGLYRLRLSQVAREFSVRLEERVGERTRIARDLHDTLLQSFQASLFEFQAARNLLARRPEDAMRTMDGAIGSAQSAITEGRNAIQNLRVGSGADGDLAHLLTTAGKELSEAQESEGEATFGLTVEGRPEALSPMIQDEVYRIGRELLRNAFQHARARKIEVEIRYDHRMFRLRIRDDGIGTDPKVLREGARPGHWGLPGVRERAKLVGAKLDFWSEVGAGTEVQVTVPSAIAYAKTRNSEDNIVSGLLRWMKPRRPID